MPDVLYICTGLKNIGVVSHVESDAIIIDSPSGPINRIERRVIFIPAAGGGVGGSNMSFIDYFISDSKSKTKKVSFRSIRIKILPILDSAVGLRWEGDDGDLDIIDRLTQDQSVRQVIMDGRDVHISRYDGGWRLSVETSEAPPKSEWDCYSAIGNHLLAARPHMNIETMLERVCTGLNGLGTDAQVTEIEHSERPIREGSLFRSQSSVGLIKIIDGPIKWIVLNTGIKRTSDGVIQKRTFSMDYGVPLTGEPRLSKVWVFALGRKRFPVFGRVVQLRWRSGKWGQEVADRLNGDALMIEPTVMDHGMELTWYPEHFCWTISTVSEVATDWRVPSMEQWNGYLDLAGHLITATQSHVQSKPPAF